MAVAGVSAVGTTGTLFLIYDMKCWNAYMRLIFHMTFCQLLSDVAFFIAPWHSANIVYFQIQVFLYTLGAVSVALWTNLISCSLFSVVIRHKNLNFGAHFDILRIAIMIPGFILGIFFALLIESDFNTVLSAVVWTQMASIGFNVIIHSTVSIALTKMSINLRDEAQRMAGVINKGNESSSPLLSPDDIQSKLSIYEPIRELAKRLKYYPVVQIIAILGQVWYFFGYNVDVLGPSSHDATLKLIAWYLYNILTPSTGIGYFIVFLNVQPYAFTHLCNRIYRNMGLPTHTRSLSFQSDQYHEPRSTLDRIPDDLSFRHFATSVDSGTSSNATMLSHLTGADASHVTSGSGNVASMDEETLMRRIRELRRANLRINDPTSSHSRASSEPIMSVKRSVDESSL